MSSPTFQHSGRDHVPELLQRPSVGGIPATEFQLQSFLPGPHPSPLALCIHSNSRRQVTIYQRSPGKRPLLIPTTSVSAGGPRSGPGGSSTVGWGLAFWVGEAVRMVKVLILFLNSPPFPQPWLSLPPSPSLQHPEGLRLPGQRGTSWEGERGTLGRSNLQVFPPTRGLAGNAAPHLSAFKQ